MLLIINGFGIIFVPIYYKYFIYKVTLLTNYYIVYLLYMRFMIGASLHIHKARLIRYIVIKTVLFNLF